MASSRSAVSITLSAAVNRNSASLSTNFLINQGHATRSTFTCSRVIHFIVDSTSRAAIEVSFLPECFFGASIYFFPFHVLHKGVDILRRRRAVVHVIGVFVHIQHQQRTAHRCVMHVIPRPVIVCLAGVHVVSENRPTRSSAKRVGCPFELCLP